MRGKCGLKRAEKRRKRTNEKTGGEEDAETSRAVVRGEKRRDEEGRGEGGRRGVWLPCETAPSCESLPRCGTH